MKLPPKPPFIPEILKTIGDKRFAEVLRALPNWTRQDRYLPWDELRRRPVPSGFSHQEWWLGLKLSRSSQLRPVPLLDKQASPFLFGQPDSLIELLHHIDRGLGMAFGLPEALGNPSTRDAYVINSLIQESITSSQLEGAATTRAVAKELLRTGRPPRDRSERMILNNYFTMQRIRDLKVHDLSPDHIFALHRLVTEGTLEKPDAAGRFRRDDENVRVEDAFEGTIYHVPPPAAELPVRLQAMCDFANERTPDYFIHPVVRAIILHFWLAYDHPFVDGNGRTARALFYWAMLHRDYSLFEFISISDVLLRAPIRYAEAFLHTETDGNDMTYFILHQAEVIRKAVEALQDYLKKKQTELHQASKNLDHVDGLNHRQQALLAHALREPHTRYLIVAHQHSHGVTHQTARDDLMALVERGLLVAEREGRRYVFRAPQDLQTKLDGLAKRPPPSSLSVDNTLPLDLPFKTKHD